MKKSVAISIAFHILICGSAVVFGGIIETRSPEPVVVIDMTEEVPREDLSGGRGASLPGKQEEPAKIEKKIKVKTHTIVGKTNKEASKNTEAAEQPAAVTTSAILPADVALASAPVAAGTGNGNSDGGCDGFGNGAGGKGGSAGGSGKGHGTGSGDDNILVEQYKAEHRAYIKKLITDNLKYPQLAKKMGWKGLVVVSILIRKNGSAEPKILTSSGYEILDRNVLATIKEVQPFPKPPGITELITDVKYKLAD